MYYVYIIQSQKDKSYYTGMTDDLKKRMSYHNGKRVKSTSAKTPYKLVWCCIFPSKQRVARFEKYLKTGSGIAFARKHLI